GALRIRLRGRAARRREGQPRDARPRGEPDDVVGQRLLRAAQVVHDVGNRRDVEPGVAVAELRRGNRPGGSPTGAGLGHDASFLLSVGGRRRLAAARWTSYPVAIQRLKGARDTAATQKRSVARTIAVAWTLLAACASIPGRRLRVRS